MKLAMTTPKIAPYEYIGDSSHGYSTGTVYHITAGPFGGEGRYAVLTPSYRLYRNEEDFKRNWRKVEA